MTNYRKMHRHTVSDARLGPLWLGTRESKFLAASLVACVAFMLSQCRKPSPPQASTLKEGLIVKAVRTAASKNLSPADILPYHDALVWQEYTVIKVLHGKLDAKNIRVAHWVVVDGGTLKVSQKIGGTATLALLPLDETPNIRGVRQVDDLDFDADTPCFVVREKPTPLSKPPTTSGYDYMGRISAKAPIFWSIRGQLQWIVMGNSHADSGIDAGWFPLDGNRECPVVFNLACAGAPTPLQCTILREWVIPLPNLSTVIWQVDARSFNLQKHNPNEVMNFLKSPGHKREEKNKAALWPVPTPAKRTSAQELVPLITDAHDAWGVWHYKIPSRMPSDPATALPELSKEMSVTDFIFDEALWNEFVSMVEELNQRQVRVFLVTTPIHPASHNLPAADRDGSTHEGMIMTAKKLDALATRLPVTWFHDFNRDGSHDHPHAHFYDGDHLNNAGSLQLTQEIWQWINTCQSSEHGQ